MRRAHLATWALLTALVGAAGEAAAQSCESYAGGFAWSCSRAIPGLACTQITEPADPHTWSDNFLCVTPARRGPPPGLLIGITPPGR